MRQGPQAFDPDAGRGQDVVVRTARLPARVGGRRGILRRRQRGAAMGYSTVTDLARLRG